jgi:hypothetical protein
MVVPSWLVSVSTLPCRLSFSRYPPSLYLKTAGTAQHLKSLPDGRGIVYNTGTMLEETGVRKGNRIVQGRLLSTLMVVLVSALLLACSPSEDKPSARTTAPEEATVSKAASLTSSDALTRDCQRGQGSSGLGVGEVAVNFTLKDTYGSEYSLSTLLAEKPVVMVFGSFT